MSAAIDVLVDASAVMKVLLGRPEKDRVINVFDYCTLHAPPVLPYEIGNALMGVRRHNGLDEHGVIGAYNDFKEIQFEYQTVFVDKALIIACKYLIYAYDAYYLEVAKRQNLPILTFDKGMIRVARDLKLNVLEV
ncbi:MAG: type II toxin-antitoxin system VapC family toxin [Chitinispirillia bacterium]|nr:type II toxin-antitoxin system VapC family toxin [Chitinispirillia bacterium]MCL2241695.1 type II toxin-antitoxin system VapC family toxin [Chitinispirillia bacterium]